MTKADEKKAAELVEQDTANALIEAPETDLSNLTDEELAPSLVGSGAKQVVVKANVGVFGIRAGQVSSLYETPEVKANIDNGNLTQIFDR